MRKSIFIVFLLFMSILSFGQGYVINGSVKGSTKGIATLRTYFRDGNEKLDSASIEEDGRFYFRGQIRDAVPALLTLNGKKTYRLYLEPGVTLEVKLVPGKEKKNRIKGSKLTDEWYEIVSPKNKEDYYVHLSRLDNWVINHPEHIFCPDIIASYLAHRWDYDELNRTLNTLKGEALNTYHYRKLRQREESIRNLKIGGKAPDLAMKNADGKQIRLGNFVRENKYTLLHFWASWSEESREENISLVSVYNKYKNKGFNIVSVSLDDDRNEWKRAIKADGLSWEQLSDLKKWESQAVEQYMLKAIPYNVLIDNEGSILAFNLKTNELSDLLKELTGSRGFEIKGSFAGLDEGVMTLELLLKDGKKERMTTKIVNGLFEFSGSVDMVCTGIITLPSRLGELSFFLGNENIEISGDVKDLDNVRISGSESNDEFLQIADMCNRKKNPMQCLMNYVLDNPQSIYSPLIISSYLAPYLNTNELREIVLRLDGQAKLTFQYDMLLKHLEELDKNEKIGQKVKDFVLNDSNGKPVSLSQFVSKNKCTLIYFWASWDNMSRLRNKELRVLYNRYKNEGFDIIGVSLDDSRAAWTNAIEEEGLKWTNVSDLKRWNSVIVKLYELEHIPQNILVDSKGNIISRNLNFEDLNQSILLYLQH